MLDDSYPSSKDNISWSFEKGRIKPRLFGFLVALVIFISSFLVTIVSISTGRENRIGEDLRPLKWLPKPSLTVDLGYVKYAGLHDNVAGIWRYRGIPYAVSPGGELRWQPPRNIESKNDFYGKTIVADTAGPLCHQICNPGVWCGRYEGQSEDCLMLDVLVPEHPVSKRLPVVVMIHGGGFTTGSVSSAPGDALVHYSKGNIIFVTIQYRLGIFGFLAGSEIRSNGVANAGLLDQRCALGGYFLSQKPCCPSVPISLELLLTWFLHRMDPTSYLILWWRSLKGHDLGRFCWWLKCDTSNWGFRWSRKRTFPCRYI